MSLWWLKSVVKMFPWRASQGSAEESILRPSPIKTVAIRSKSGFIHLLRSLENLAFSLTTVVRRDERHGSLYNAIPTTRSCAQHFGDRFQLAVPRVVLSCA
jgi:hypothetical protein